ncbi:hypothetical protein AMTRI_Chr07g80490 [Amborella trichopoda]|uniref:Histone deacetylase complex subunit SAP30 Sin3 binding domain-containing protein n=1 Tax=Amborella trichopoda TaxID=13333 RepID=W1NID8_AMBTC|nr:uncharacterized protein LOC18422966 isoform X1 [Amborella trichopoda]XP_020525473.1 uncharacterized protein LOC18422966 isoform X1 [Amborella trichopoda]ERM94945.1 hypothetical protein AMTR_s00009p00203940 [Amborella trichopoda]|eukprot:XP_011624727.1 uncharacterized protein LOC18422966 isoform X1 [Amborella trichopoda]
MLCSSRALSPSRVESGEEELCLLPRHTKVIVTGNNRTKSVLVGLQGVVKKAVGLGGWHWLILKNGTEVKLQRNALSVLEPPRGDEDDYQDNDPDNNSMCSSSENDISTTDFHKKARPRVRHPKPWSTSLKSVKSHLRDTQPTANHQLRVNLAKLDMATLWSYLTHFNIVGFPPNPSKEQLVQVVEQHFIEQEVDEVQVILEFIQAAKRLKIVS